jgi:hypothetical protein
MPPTVEMQGHDLLAAPDVDLLEAFHTPHDPVAADRTQIEHCDLKRATSELVT